MEVDCVAFWACRCYSMVVGLSGQGQAASNVETFPEVSVAQKWGDETDRWLLGQCWLPWDDGIYGN